MLRRSPGLCVLFIIKTRFRQFDIPVTNLAPDKIINKAACFAQFKPSQKFGNILSRMLQPRKYPLISKRIGSLFGTGIIAFHIHQRKARRIPDLIGEITCRFHTFPVKTHIITGCIACDQHKAQSIRTILFDNFQRIDTIAQRFTHLTTLTVTHQTMNKDLIKRNILHKFHTHDQHPCYPEENDVITGHQNTGGIKLLQQRRFFRPAHRGKRP